MHINKQISSLILLTIILVGNPSLTYQNEDNDFFEENSEILSETDLSPEQLFPHSQDGLDLDYETNQEDQSFQDYNEKPNKANPTIHPNPTNQEDPNDYITHLSEEERKEYTQKQHQQMSICIVFTQVFLSANKQGLHELISSRKNFVASRDLEKAKRKAQSGVIINCMEHITEEEVQEIQRKFQKRDYDFSQGFDKLNRYDYEMFGDENFDLELNEYEKGVYTIYEQYEKKVIEEQNKQSGSSNSESNGSKGSNSGNYQQRQQREGHQGNGDREEQQRKRKGSSAPITIMGINSETFAHPLYVLVVFLGIFVLAFYVNKKLDRFTTVTYVDSKTKIAQRKAKKQEQKTK